MSNLPFLTFITFFPLFSALFILLLNNRMSGMNRMAAIGSSLITLVATAVVWLNFDPQSSGMQFEQRWDWIPSIGVEYHVGIDGLGLVMIMLA